MLAKSGSWRHQGRGQRSQFFILVRIVRIKERRRVKLATESSNWRDQMSRLLLLLLLLLLCLFRATHKISVVLITVERIRICAVATLDWH